VEILLYNTSTKSSSNRAPFDKISKSEDGGGSGGSLDTKASLSLIIASFSLKTTLNL
jgi:hypothetical protein